MSDFWHERWQSNSTGWDLGREHKQCHDILAWISQHYKIRSGFVPGCGRAHDAAFFARHGIPTLAVDHVSKAIEEAREIHGETTGLEFKVADLLNKDVFLADSFDFVFDRAVYCALNKEQRETYFSNIKHWLEPGGIFSATLFTQRAHSPEKGPPFQVNLLAFLKECENHFTIEDVYEYDAKDLEIITQEARVILKKRKAA